MIFHIYMFSNIVMGGKKSLGLPQAAETPDSAVLLSSAIPASRLLF
jgi:hypothetical protein